MRPATYPPFLLTDLPAVLGLPGGVNWLAGTTCVVLVGWFVLSNWEKLERVAGWLSAGQRRREAEVARRLDVLEGKGFVDGKTLGEQFDSINRRLELHGAALVTGKEAQHAAQHEHEAVLSEVRRNRLDIEKLQHLEPRLTEAEKSIALIIQKMESLEKGQDRIIDNQETNLETVLTAIRDLK